MSTLPYPYLTSTLGEATDRLPPELAEPLEAVLAVAMNAPGAITLQGCLQRIRAGDAADGQPWPRPTLTTGQALTLARADRAAAGLSTLLEILHASERLRVDGEPAQHVGDGTREGLLLACRGLAEYVELQLHAA